jgi:hypothetical protein
MILRSKFLWVLFLATKDEVINALCIVVRRVGRRMEYKGMGHKELYDEEREGS